MDKRDSKDMWLRDVFKDKLLIRQSWAVSWPMVLVMFFVCFIGITDVYVAGLLGKRIQAAYGLASQIYFVFSIFAMALSVGGVSIVSRLFTADKEHEFNVVVGSTIILAVISGITLSVISFLAARPLIYIINIPAELKAHTVSFARFYSAGLLFSYLLISTNGVLRACKMVRKSLLTVALVCISNVALNFIFVFLTPLESNGIAAATLVSNCIGCLINLAFIKRIMTEPLKYSWAAVKNIIRIGWPAGLLQGFWQLAAFVLYLILSAFSVHGIEVLAAFTNGLKVESAVFMPAFAFNMAAAVLVGNLLGRANKEDAFRTGVVTAFIGVIIVFLASLIVILNAPCIAAFFSRDRIVVTESIRYISISLLCEPVMAWGIILAGALNGAGDTKGVMKIIALSIWIVRIPLSYLLGVYLGLGPAAVWWSMNLSILTQTFFIHRRYFSRKWIASSEAFIRTV